VPASLFIEHQAHGLAFYINGELQFHTADEAIYHEFLVIPAIAMAVRRFPHMPLRVLICGGGDGLAAREVLKFPKVGQIDLVDYDPDVLELGKTTFAPFNQSSLLHPKVNVQVGEAFAYMSEVAIEIEQGDRDPYHVIIADFTYPHTSQETQIYSLEWFQLARRILATGGLMTQNAVSPQCTPTGFWCLYQTILASGLLPKPMQIDIPSFQMHDYGDWGFLLASDFDISKRELCDLELPDNLQALTSDRLLGTFVFAQSNAAIRHQVIPHSQTAPQLFYYLLNPINPVNPINPGIDPLPDNSEAIGDSTDRAIDFLEIDAVAEQALLSQSRWSQVSGRELDPLQLQALARVWLEQAERDELNREILLPVQHPYHAPHMTTEWLGSAKNLLGQIDLSRLFQKILERSPELPAKVTDDLQRSLADLSASSNSSVDMQGSDRHTPANTTKVLIMLTLTLLVANVVAPDSVFAKGSYGRSGSIDSGDGGFGWLGLFMLIGGGVWLANLMEESSKNR
jgi:spermidine synthase